MSNHETLKQKLEEVMDEYGYSYRDVASTLADMAGETSDLWRDRDRGNDGEMAAVFLNIADAFRRAHKEIDANLKKVRL